jgi:hypothetical protein
VLVAQSAEAEGRLKRRRRSNMKTVKVRIALEIDPEGNWQASGCGGPGMVAMDWGDHMAAFDAMDDGARHWIEAEVPVPEAEPQTLAGKAVEEKEEAERSAA